MSIRQVSESCAAALAIPRESKCRTCHVKVHPCSRSDARATQKYIHVLEVLRLPHKSSRAPAATKRARLLVQDRPEQAIVVGKSV